MLSAGVPLEHTAGRIQHKHRQRRRLHDGAVAFKDLQTFLFLAALRGLVAPDAADADDIAGGVVQRCDACLKVGHTVGGRGRPFVENIFTGQRPPVGGGVDGGDLCPKDVGAGLAEEEFQRQPAARDPAAIDRGMALVGVQRKDDIVKGVGQTAQALQLGAFSLR